MTRVATKRMAPPATEPAPQLKVKIQLIIGEEIALGPGKADLLDAIEKTGSISAAARAMGLSYRRAWQLVDTMNRRFRAPVVEAGRGGIERGGAKVTAFGVEVLAQYRQLQQGLERTAAPHAEALIAQLKR
jgi:molybdate transport system regulatory protein